MATTQLRDAGIGAGDEVVLPAFGGAEVAAAVRAVGAEPVLVDIDPRSYCLDPKAAAAALTARTAAVAAVDLFGHSADLARLGELADRSGVRLIQVGARSERQTLESARRRRYASYLSSRLTGVVVPSVVGGATHDFSEYVVRVPGNGRPDRDAFKHALRSRGVRCWVPVKLPVHRMPDFRSAVRLPEAERAADECLALPIDGTMTQRELQRMVSACNALGGLLLEPAC